MKSWELIIVGAIAWQLICFMVASITDDDDAIQTAAFGIWIFPAVIIAATYRACRLWYYKHYYNGYRLYHNNVSSSTFYMSNRRASNFNLDENAEYFVKKVSDGQTWKSAPYKQEVYSGSKYFMGYDMSLYQK